MVDGLGATDGLADSRHTAIGDKLGLGSLDVLDASLLELGVDVVLGDLDLELTGEGIERKGLAGNIVGLLVKVADELLHGQAGSRQPGVEGHAAGSEVGQEVLAKLLKDGLLVVGVHLVELQALGESGDATVLLLGRQAGSLVLLDLDLDGVAHSVDAVEAKVGLDELVGELGGVADLDALDGDLDGVGLGLLALLGLVGPGDGLDVVNVGADQGLVELLGVAVATGDEHAALGSEVVGVLDGLEVDGHIVVSLDGATLDVLEGGTVVEEHLDLVIDLGLGDLRGRHLDLDSVEGRELGSRTQGELDGVGVVLVILGEVELLVVTVLGGDDVQLVEDGGLVGSDQVVGGLSEGSLGAKSGVDDRTGGLACTEAREAVLLGGVLVGLLDRGVDVGGRDGDRSGELGVLDVRSGDVQHVPPHTAQLI